MKQAIEEKFILEVLKSTPRTKLLRGAEVGRGQPVVRYRQGTEEAEKAFVEASPRTIEVKARIMVDHFVASVWQAKKLKGKAKAMVVTRNIECAIRCLLRHSRRAERGQCAVQGAGSVLGRKRWWTALNTSRSPERFFCARLARRIEKDDAKILVVANKYLTGFDEPMLHTMYVDKSCKAF